jgi:hypothetical protein
LNSKGQEKGPWVKIRELSNAAHAAIIQGLLQSAGIDSRIINKQDSVYISLQVLQSIDIYVQADDVIRAQHLLLAHE